MEVEEVAEAWIVTRMKQQEEEGAGGHLCLGSMLALGCECALRRRGTGGVGSPACGYQGKIHRGANEVLGTKVKVGPIVSTCDFIRRKARTSGRSLSRCQHTSILEL